MNDDTNMPTTHSDSYADYVEGYPDDDDKNTPALDLVPEAIDYRNSTMRFVASLNEPHMQELHNAGRELIGALAMYDDIPNITFLHVWEDLINDITRPDDYAIIINRFGATL